MTLTILPSSLVSEARRLRAWRASSAPCLDRASGASRSRKARRECQAITLVLLRRGGAMTENEARTECARLARQDPARGRFAWFARETAAGDWSIVRVPIGDLRV